jgi:hypothetical protein
VILLIIVPVRVPQLTSCYPSSESQIRKHESQGTKEARSCGEDPETAG